MKTMMNRIGMLALVIAVGFASCSEPVAQQETDACSCAKEEFKTEKNADVIAQCASKRKADATFEQAYQKCLLAAGTGLDTSKVSISKIDSLQGLPVKAPINGVYQVMGEKSNVRWLAKKVTGQHNGSIAVKGGSMNIEGESLIGGDLVIDMGSLLVLDQTGDAKADLEGHLKSADFFNVSKFPETRMVITSVKKRNKHEYEVVADLTLLGVTKPVKSTVLVVPSGDSMANISGGIAIDRTEFGLKYGSGKFFQNLGDKMIDDVFMVTFDLKAQRN
jgi:polyisoprenoid-binding protein YceI